MEKIKLDRGRITLIRGDSFEIVPKLKRGIIDLVVTSPPYNMRSTRKGKAGGKWNSKLLEDGYETFSDDMPEEEYVSIHRNLLSSLFDNCLSDSGAVFYNHKWRIQKGRLLQLPEKIINGFPLRQIIIWQRSGGHNFNKGYFLPTYEQVYLLARDGFKLADKANTYTDVWKITQELKNDHPAPYPLELAERCVIATNAEMVLDPFLGSGTTAVACINNGRRFVGIEREEKFFQMAVKRCEEALAERDKLKVVA